MDVALIPTIALFAIQLIYIIMPQSYSGFFFMLILSLVLTTLTLLPVVIYLYTGYSAIKKYKLTLGEAFLVGAVISAIITLIKILLHLPVLGEAVFLVSWITSALVHTVNPEQIVYVSILVLGSLFDGFLALAGGVLAKLRTPEASQKYKKPSSRMIVRALVILALIIIIIFVVLIPLFVLIQSFFATTPGIMQCYFSTEFTCVADKLQATTSKLYLKIGQGTGHNIKINGINCTQETDIGKMTSGAYIYYPNYNLSGASVIEMRSGSTAIVADSIGVNPAISGSPANATNIICSTAAGEIPSDTEVSSLYLGKIYINYTELDTGAQRIIVGTYATRHEA